MRPRRIRALNFGPFEELDLQLPLGVCVILGEIRDASPGVNSNGAGKSHLIESIPLALFGPGDGIRTLAPYLTEGGFATELMVETEVEHGDDVFRIRRGYSARGAGRSIAPDFERLVDGEWEPLTAGSKVDTQTLVDETFGLSRETFLASACALQDTASFADPSVKPAQRKQLLANALRLSRWERQYGALATADRKQAKDSLTRLEGRLADVTADTLRVERERLEAAIHDLLLSEAAATTALKTAETALSTATEAMLAEQHRETERQAAVSRRDAAAAAHTARTQLREDALQAALAVAEIKGELAALPARDLEGLEAREQEIAAAAQRHTDALRERDETRRLRELRETEKRTIEAQADAATRKAAELDEKIEHITDGQLDSCPTCQQLLGVEARSATIGSLRAQAQTATTEAEALFERAGAIVLPDVPEEPEPLGLDGALETVRQQIREGREADLQAVRLSERLIAHTRTIAAASDLAYLAELDRLGEERQAAEDALAALPTGGDFIALRDAAVRAQATVEIARAQVGKAQRDKAVEQERLAQHEASAERHAADVKDRDTLLGELADRTELEQAYGRNGIPTLVLENTAIPWIEAEANRIISLLGLDLQLELRTQTALASGDGVKDSLDVVIVSDNGERPYQRCSGGERSRIAVALQVALACFLVRHGADAGLLILDEPKYLDQSGMESLAALLHELQDTFATILLVSHLPELRDAFEQTITVVRENDRSRIEGAEVAAEVAA